MNKRLFALGRLKAGQLNKTEQAYQAELEARKASGSVLWYSFEAMTFKLADATRYTPDFIVLTSDHQLEAHEVKGSRAIFRDDARVKIKVAAELFPVRFLAVYPKPKKAGGGWDEEDFSRQ